MYFGLFIILVPLIIGYLFPKLPNFFLQSINLLLSIIVYIILFFMGIRLALLPYLSNSFFLVSIYFLVSALCILTMNVLALSLLEKIFPWTELIIYKVQPISNFRIILNSFQLCAFIFLGFFIGLTNIFSLNQTAQISKILLILLLCFIGIQLRHSGITIKQIFINRRGMIIALVVAISALIGGALAAILLGLPLPTGLAIASAYGWYSLSGILITDYFGSIIGSTAFFNDLCRELLSMMLIPSLIKRHRRNTALGLCGATSMDFTLPILQRSGGIEIVPVAIIHGFLLSLLAPILIALFSMSAK